VRATLTVPLMRRPSRPQGMPSDSGRAALAPAGREKGVDAGEEDPKGLCVHTFRAGAEGTHRRR